MTGSRVKLRRWSGCNLHWYTPGVRNRNRRRRSFADPAGFLTRYRLYVTESDSYRQLHDKRGPYVWMAPDCGWEWLATRKLIYPTPLFAPLDALHDHVHTPHREDRMNVPLILQRAVVRLRRSTDLDERWGTDVFPDAHSYWIRVRFKDLSDDEILALNIGLPEPGFSEVSLSTVHCTVVDWYEKASSPTHAMKRAQARVHSLGVNTGGFWEAPLRLRLREEESA